MENQNKKHSKRKGVILTAIIIAGILILGAFQLRKQDDRPLLDIADKLSEDEYINKYCADAYQGIDFDDIDYVLRKYEDTPKKFLLDCYKAIRESIKEAGGYENYINILKKAKELEN